MSWFHHLHGSCSSRVKTHLIAQTHISSMDVLHVSFRHDIFSYERRVVPLMEMQNESWVLN